ncbi:aminotransferase-like domain-containing protein [Streptomyces sp. NPDC004393]|uniref:aminotransferase-like domain-containing protein n=1 Tax=Streptomyces sp. NPDC004533 TaxID=3154278 RepID=UPI0033AD27B4
MGDYRSIADRIAADISEGRLKPGQRLPPQRQFARRRGIAASTAGRVYGELVRRGLVVGEVGRGTFVRASPASPGRAPAGAAPRASVDLELDHPAVPGQSELLAAGIAPLLRPDILAEATRTAVPAGTPAARETAAGLLATADWQPAPDRVLFAGSARQALAGTLAALVRPGGRIGVEWLTHPLVKEVAARLGIVLVPLATDEQGLRPDALAAAHRATPLSALYVQPTLHHPTSVTTGQERRRQLAAAARALRLPVVEDRVWSFLCGPEGGAPLAAYAPERTYVVDGLSLRVAPGLTVGFLVVPEGRGERTAGALRSGGWTAGRFALEASVRWIEDGVVARLVAAKRADAAARQRLVAEHLDGFALRADPRAYFVWWRLPRPWRAEAFTAAAAERGIAVTPGPAFAAAGRGAQDAAADCVRLSLASAPPPELARALRILADVARTGP